MTLEELKNKLDKGEQWGFLKETDNPDYLGWILLSKRMVPPSTTLDPSEGERYLRLKKEMDDRRTNPYHLKILELRKDVHESGEYESAEDYRLRENFYFSTLEEATNKIEQMGYSISDIKPRWDIDAP